MFDMVCQPSHRATGQAEREWGSIEPRYMLEMQPSFFYQPSDSVKMPPKKDITSESGPLNLLRPLLLLSYSAYYIVPTIIDLLLSFQLAAFFSFSEFKDHWFARFWAFFGPRSRDFAAPAVLPLLENSATGVCLDIGNLTSLTS